MSNTAGDYIVAENAHSSGTPGFTPLCILCRGSCCSCLFVSLFCLCICHSALVLLFVHPDLSFVFSTTIFLEYWTLNIVRFFRTPSYIRKNTEVYGCFASVKRTVHFFIVYQRLTKRLCQSLGPP